MAQYNFKKDAVSDDGKEISRYLQDGNKLENLPSGSYRIASGTNIGPGSLGVLPPSVTYRLNGDGSMTVTRA